MLQNALLDFIWVSLQQPTTVVTIHPFTKEKTDQEKLHVLLRVTQILRGGAKIQAQVFWLQFYDTYSLWGKMSLVSVKWT